MRTFRPILTLALMTVAVSGWAAAATLKPFVLADTPPGDSKAVEQAVREKLTASGFEIVGSYSPFANATVLVATTEDLKTAAAETEFGGYAAAERISITEVGGKVQVAYTNPPYYAAAYRLKSDLAGVKSKLASALGSQKEFGSAAGLTEEKLRKYQYMMAMERFDSTKSHLLKEHKSHQEALDAVEAGLAAEAGGVKKVYRIDIPGKEQVVFGVALTKGEGADEHVMKVADTADLRHTAHLPYEILVSGSKVYHLYMRFRMAIDFPDLTMRTFGKLMSSPKATAASLKQVAEGKASAK